MGILVFVSNRASDSILGIILLRRRISLFTQDISSLVLVLSSDTWAPQVVESSQQPNNLPVNCNRILFREKCVFIYFNKKEIKKEELSPRKHHKKKSKKYSKFEKTKLQRENPNSRKFAKNRKFENSKNSKIKRSYQEEPKYSPVVLKKNKVRSGA